MTLKYHGFSVTSVSFGFTSPATLTVKLIWKDNIYVKIVTLLINHLYNHLL